MRHARDTCDVRIFQIAKGSTGLPGGNSEREPPDPISNSEVKTLSADGSVGSPHVRVGHRQALNTKGRNHLVAAFFMFMCLELRGLSQRDLSVALLPYDGAVSRMAYQRLVFFLKTITLQFKRRRQ